MEYEYDESVFNKIQKAIINKFIESNIDKELFKVLTSTKIIPGPKPYVAPVFNTDMLRDILTGVEYGLTAEQLNICVRLDIRKNPVYNFLQMREIILGFRNSLSEDKVNIYARCENDKPVYSCFNMNIIRNVIMSSNEKQIQQIKKMADNNLDFGKMLYILDPNIPAENMRIMHSLCDSGCNKDFIRVTALNNYSYESLKDLKYMVKCAKYFELDPNVLFESKKLDIPSIRMFLSEKICEIDKFSKFYQIGEEAILNKIIECKIEPKLIEFIISPDYQLNLQEMEAVEIGFLDGLTTEDMKDVFKKSYPGVEEIRKNIKEKINEKFFAIKDAEENISFMSSEEEIIL